MDVLYWILWIVGGLVAVAVVFAVIATIVGARYEKNHTAVRSLQLNQIPETIWAVITDHANETTWQPNLKSTRRLPDKNGHEVWEVHYKGGPPMTLETTESIPPRHLVGTIDDAKKVFSGRWEFHLEAKEGGTRLTLTEHGEIPNAFFRGMFRIFGDPAMYIEQYLKALAKKFGQEAVFVS